MTFSTIQKNACFCKKSWQIIRKAQWTFLTFAARKQKPHPNPPQREGTELPRSESTNPQEPKNLKPKNLKTQVFEER